MINIYAIKKGNTFF